MSDFDLRISEYPKLFSSQLLELISNEKNYFCERQWRTINDDALKRVKKKHKTSIMYKGKEREIIKRRNSVSASQSKWILKREGENHKIYALNNTFSVYALFHLKAEIQFYSFYEHKFISSVQIKILLQKIMCINFSQQLWIPFFDIKSEISQLKYQESFIMFSAISHYIHIFHIA